MMVLGFLVVVFEAIITIYSLTLRFLTFSIKRIRKLSEIFSILFIDLSKQSGRAYSLAQKESLEYQRNNLFYQMSMFMSDFDTMLLKHSHIDYITKFL